MQTEKVDLENTVVDESQRQLKELEPSSGLRQDKSSGMIRRILFHVFMGLVLALSAHIALHD